MNPPDVPPPGAFSRVATLTAPPGAELGLVYVSGIGGFEEKSTDTGGVVDPTKLTAAEETCNAIKAMGRCLEAAGSGLESVVNVTMLLSDRADYAECNAEYVKHFDPLPSRACMLWGVPTAARVAFSCTAVKTN